MKRLCSLLMVVALAPGLSDRPSHRLPGSRR